jgi:hypothetical protein
MYRPPRPQEELVLDLVFESHGEDRYNRTPDEYERLSALVANLHDVYYRVNKRLEEYKKSGQPRWYAIVYFKAGDLTPRYEPFPEAISMETIRTALIFSGFREPKPRKRAVTL